MVAIAHRPTGRPSRSFLPPFLAGVLVLGAVLAGCTAPGPAPPVIPGPPGGFGAFVPGNLTVHMLDVGQGQAMLLTTPTGAAVLYDGGPSDRGQDVVAWLRAQQVERIDWMVLSHAHADHIGGFLAVLEAMPVAHVLDPGVPYGSATYGEVQHAAERAGARVLSPRNGSLLPIDAQVRVEVMNPPDSLHAGGDPQSVDENTLVLLWTFGGFDVLLTGDLPWRIEASLVPRLVERLGVDLEVLQVAHHGSGDATSTDLLRATTPDLALISAGQGNEFGHPHQATLDRLAEHNATALRTDLHGSITVTSDGEGGFDVATSRGEIPSRVAP